MTPASGLTIAPDSTLTPAELAIFHPRLENYQDCPLVFSTGKQREGLAFIEKNELDWGPGTNIIHIFVKPAFRRQGLGTRLLHTLLEEARQRNASQLVSAFSCKIKNRGTPPPEARFAEKNNARIIKQLDTFHLDQAHARNLIDRILKLSARAVGKFQWIPASALSPDSYNHFVKSNIGSVLPSAHATVPAPSSEMAELSIAALLPDQITIAGLIVPAPNTQLVATLDYHIFAVAPAFRRTPLAAALLARSIGSALQGHWKDSRFNVLRDPNSAMWSFAKKHATLRGTSVTFAFDP